jgi:hypothetical protein
MTIPNAETGRNLPEAKNLISALAQVAQLPMSDLISEENVKIKVILPMLRAFGYDDSDFNYERRTGRGYVDVSVERFQTGIVVEAKSPRTRLDRFIEQLESYVFHRHGAERTTIAILTNGELFNIYGITGALFKGSLESYLTLSFSRPEIVGADLASKLASLLGKDSNQDGTIDDVISTYRSEYRVTQERLAEIQASLRDLNVERQRVDAHMQKLQAESVSLLKTNSSSLERPIFQRGSEESANFPAIAHILRLLAERGAKSRTEAVQRKWLDEQIINRVEGVKTHQAVSWGLIQLKKNGQVEYEGNPIKLVWLKQ